MSIYKDIKYKLQVKTTLLLIHSIVRINPYKDNSLAKILHSLADKYDTRPSNKWG